MALRAGIAALAALGLLPAAAPAAGAWRDTAALGIPRTDHTATLLADGRVLVTGGTSGFSETQSAEIYDPLTQHWSATQPMGVARSHHAALLLGGAPCAAPAPPAWCGRVLVTGGATAELYDPATGTWAAAADPGVSRIRHTATQLPDGRVLVAGGTGAGGALASAQLYDPGADAWAPTSEELATARLDHTATLLAGGQVLVAGGRGAAATPLETSELFTPADGMWSPAGTMRSGRFDAAASILPDGDVLVTGGFDGAGPRRVVDRFDAISGWAAPAAPIAPSMASLRSQHTATLLTAPGCGTLCGRVLVAGGGSESTADVFTSELYDPVADAWAATGSLQTPRSRHTATLLAGPGCGTLCGLVLAAGGTRSSQPTASAELYDPARQPVPGRVSDLAAAATASNRVVLTFSAPASDGRAPPPAGRYVVAQARTPLLAAGAFATASKLCGGSCAFAPAQIGDRITLTVTGLAAGVRYHYALRALGAGGALGALSNPAAATTAPARVAPPRAPGAISGLSVRVLGPHSVRLEFVAPLEAGPGSGPARRYVVKRARRPIAGAAAFAAARASCAGVCTARPPAAGARTAITLMNLTPRRTWHLALRARSGAGVLGPVSRSVRVRMPADRVPPGAVTGLRARALSAGRVRLSFRAPRSDRRRGPVVRAYEVRQSRSPIRTARQFRQAQALCRRGCRFSPSGAGARISLTVTGLCRQTRYYYAIRARDGAGNVGRRSRFAPVRTSPGPRRPGC